MKLLCPFFLLVFISINAFSQSFSLPELIRISKMNMEDFKTHLNSYRGYSRDKNTQKYIDTSQLESYEYIGSYWEGRNYKGSYWERRILKAVGLEISNENVTVTSFETIKKSEYLKIKDDLKILGFQFFKSKPIFGKFDGKVKKSVKFFSYKKNNQIVTLSISDFYDKKVYRIDLSNDTKFFQQ